jgi:hypothetical protein
MKNMAAILFYFVIGITACPSVCMASSQILQCEMKMSADGKKECKKDNCPMQSCCNCCCFCCFNAPPNATHFDFTLKASANKIPETVGAFAISGFTTENWQPPEILS